VELVLVLLFVPDLERAPSTRTGTTPSAKNELEHEHGSTAPRSAQPGDAGARLCQRAMDLLQRAAALGGLVDLGGCGDELFGEAVALAVRSRCLCSRVVALLRAQLELRGKAPHGLAGLRSFAASALRFLG